jgi:hypothetical protein
MESLRADFSKMDLNSDGTVVTFRVVEHLRHARSHAKVRAMQESREVLKQTKAKLEASEAAMSRGLTGTDISWSDPRAIEKLNLEAGENAAKKIEECYHEKSVSGVSSHNTQPDPRLPPFRPQSVPRSLSPNPFGSTLPSPLPGRC